MRSAPSQHSSYAQRAPAGRRATAFLVALAINLLLVVMLLTLAPSPSGSPAARSGTMLFQLLPERQKGRSQAAPRRASIARARPKPSPVRPRTSDAPLPMITLTREEFAASDISRLPSHPEDRRAAADAAEAGGGQGDTPSSGGGPNGERLYQAQWYREPTHAELAFYLPPGGPPIGWADIACQTVERYHVDNCRELGDSPPGSGLAGAIRQAAWQFLVRPPRIGGRTLIGAWVRIHIDFEESRIK